MNSGREVQLEDNCQGDNEDVVKGLGNEKEKRVQDSISWNK